MIDGFCYVADDLLLPLLLLLLLRLVASQIVPVDSISNRKQNSSLTDRRHANSLAILYRLSKVLPFLFFFLEMKVRESFFFFSPLQLQLIGIQPLNPHRLRCLLQSTSGSATENTKRVRGRALKANGVGGGVTGTANQEPDVGGCSGVTGPANQEPDVVYFMHG